MKAWINHFALNLGSALACLYYAVIPPRWTGHKEEEVELLKKLGFVSGFLVGLGLFEEKEIGNKSLLSGSISLGKDYFVSEFYNENGKLITVSCRLTDGEKLVVMSMEGPDSLVENTITPIEGKEVLEGLSYILERLDCR